ncbi:acyltransferase family protein [Paenibacillus sp. NPDC057934]|uniref:acyltransferase family protein n=1 Tax=Paenibacillus sp. NPDC057934 TaxID=3346282 RepID=UPI0036DF4D39
MQKIKYLDGLRGLAALFVVFSHFVVAFYPALYTSDVSQIHTAKAVELDIAKSPLNLLYNGNFAVCIFFVLSGYVLSYKFFSTKDNETLVASAVKRYFRLLVPIFFTVFLVFLLMKCSLFSNTEAGKLSFSEWWLGTFWNFDESFLHAIKYATFEAIFEYNDQYNTVLWTMTYEMYGSFLVFGFVSLFGKTRNRYLFYILIIILFFKTYYLAFILGMILSDLNSNGYFNKTSKNLGWFKMILLALGLYLGSYPMGAVVDDSIYNYIKVVDLQGVIIYHIVGALLVMLVLLNSVKLQEFFSYRVFNFLGKVSFSLYLIHVIVIGSFTSYIFVLLNERMAYSISVFISIILSIPLLAILSYLMYKYVDKKGIEISGKLYNRFFKQN